jgi:4'-phosphopantetheinyl transferase
MPLIIYQRQIGEKATLVVWRASETTDQLLQKARLTSDQRAVYDQIHLEKRRREWLCTQILLRLIGGGRTLDFLPNGKPFLSGNYHISISHCGNLAGIVISPQPIGMDIQGVDEKIMRIRTKFCNEAELQMLGSDPSALERYTMIWSAKEAIFKHFGEHVDFADDIHMHPFSAQNDELLADYTGKHGKALFTLSHFTLLGYHIIVTH